MKITIEFIIVVLSFGIPVLWLTVNTTQIALMFMGQVIVWKRQVFLMENWGQRGSALPGKIISFSFWLIQKKVWLKYFLLYFEKFRDWGDYCEYIERPGDIQEYRSCVLTCSTHGCNPAASLRATLIPAIVWSILRIFV